MRTTNAPTTMLDPIWSLLPILLILWWVTQWIN